MRYPLGRVVGILILACIVHNVPIALSATQSFSTYWFQGKAELSQYALKQARYGEINDGTVTLIYVTEDFLPDEQVKADHPDPTKTRAISVLKLNMIRRFVTGIYDYSAMTSIFTPIDPTYPRTLKITTSVQDWCGQTFLQYNFRDGHYKILGRSYFESEGDDTVTLDGAVTEESLWTRIRIDPQKLPTGTVRLIPSGLYSRFSHSRLSVISAEVSLDTQGDMDRYRIHYPTLNRTVVIRFEKIFPHRIDGWQETTDSFGKRLTSTAKRIKTILSDYWNHKKTTDIPLRKTLGIYRLSR